MRHLKSGRKLNRNSSHRTSLFRNLAIDIIRHGAVVTSLAKAKEVRRILEPMITRAKIDTVANRRLLFARLRNKEAVHLLFTSVSVTARERPGGYLSIIRYGYRAGDNSPLAHIRLVDYNTVASGADLHSANNSNN